MLDDSSGSDDDEYYQKKQKDRMASGDPKIPTYEPSTTNWKTWVQDLKSAMTTWSGRADDHILAWFDVAMQPDSSWESMRYCNRRFDRADRVLGGVLQRIMTSKSSELSMRSTNSVSVELSIHHRLVRGRHMLSTI